MIGHRVVLYRKGDTCLEGTLVSVDGNGVVLHDPDHEEFLTGFIPWGLIAGILTNDKPEGKKG